MNLFDHAVDQSTTYRPLADAVRPTEIEQLYGQRVADGPLSAVCRMIETDSLTNAPLWTTWCWQDHTCEYDRPQNKGHI